MLAKTHCEKATNKRFKAKLKPYHHHFEKCAKAVRVHHGRSEKKIRLGDLVTIPYSDLHHVMDSSAMLAISHAIEDIAGEERTGELIATFQDFKNFLPYKGRYMSLAEDLDASASGAAANPRKSAAKSTSSRPTKPSSSILARSLRQPRCPRCPAVQTGQSRREIRGQEVSRFLQLQSLFGAVHSVALQTFLVAV